MRRPIASFAVLISVLVTGCATNYIQEFHGEVRNLKQDGTTEVIHRTIGGTSSGPSRDRGRYLGFAMGFSVFLFHPEFTPIRKFPKKTELHQVDAWLVRRGDYWRDHFSFREGLDAEQLQQLGGEKLDGQVTVRWVSNLDFNIAVDLAAREGSLTSLRGEFVGRQETEFDPKQLLIGPAMMMGFGGASMPSGVPAGRPVPNPKPVAQPETIQVK